MIQPVLFCVEVLGNGNTRGEGCVQGATQTLPAVHGHGTRPTEDKPLHTLPHKLMTGMQDGKPLTAAELKMQKEGAKYDVALKWERRLRKNKHGFFNGYEIQNAMGFDFFGNSFLDHPEHQQRSAPYPKRDQPRFPAQLSERIIWGPSDPLCYCWWCHDITIGFRFCVSGC